MLSPSTLIAHGQIAAVRPVVADGIRASLADALHTVFAAAIPLSIAALVAVIFMPELPLRSSSPGADG
jgi:hypothetical protein